MKCSIRSIFLLLIDLVKNGYIYSQSIQLYSVSPSLLSSSQICFYLLRSHRNQMYISVGGRRVGIELLWNHGFRPFYYLIKYHGNVTYSTMFIKCPIFLIGPCDRNQTKHFIDKRCKLWIKHNNLDRCCLGKSLSMCFCPIQNNTVFELFISLKREVWL